ncbi:MAG: hypothetical protein ACIAQZ_13110 [Sedimentisphaeraceae bacterium JB056]
MKMKNLSIVLILLAGVLASVSTAEVLFEDNFDSYQNLPEEVLSWGFAGLQASAPDMWQSPFTGGSSDAKVGPGSPGLVYWSGNDSTDNQLRLYKSLTDGYWGSDYTVSVDYIKLTDRNTTDGDGNGWVDYEDYVPEVYVGARISGADYVIGGIVLADNYDDESGAYNYDTSTWAYIGDDFSKNEIYARIRDSKGGSNGDTYVGKLDPTKPVNMTLEMNGNVATLTITHNGLVTTVALNTTVTDNGNPGFGVWRRWGGYAKAYMDNFSVNGEVYIPFVEGDIDGDNIVDLKDLAILAYDWTKCTDPADTNCDQFWK